MREWEIGAVENIHGALPYIRFAPILALVGVGVNRNGKDHSFNLSARRACFTIFLPTDRIFMDGALRAPPTIRQRVDPKLSTTGVARPP